ncbi:hypothetical protein IMG5_085970 [Ichthyophthirius multifiliis]|uniref:Transmembrane protein n=1 Tax=Ichthyophthirius multifiliis TaxID=5932 RepID=G0QQY7_ICHMU|nr:hypothetical protein IMG5_085970 [Ichthyophthirius multifiliis]EGR32365.1 hypothetical protein IMG5_085970 [Ichthyophthirius multifiliis]|eukprot:XP_004035851.1 hypothetical protein IMG5_085970 [Ichthyophthirius multifiliis]
MQIEYYIEQNRKSYQEIKIRKNKKNLLLGISFSIILMIQSLQENKMKYKLKKKLNKQKYFLLLKIILMIKINQIQMMKLKFYQNKHLIKWKNILNSLLILFLIQKKLNRIKNIHNFNILLAEGNQKSISQKMSFLLKHQIEWKLKQTNILTGMKFWIFLPEEEDLNFLKFKKMNNYYLIKKLQKLREYKKIKKNLIILQKKVLKNKIAISINKIIQMDMIVILKYLLIKKQLPFKNQKSKYHGSVLQIYLKKYKETRNQKDKKEFLNKLRKQWRCLNYHQEWKSINKNKRLEKQCNLKVFQVIEIFLQKDIIHMKKIQDINLIKLKKFPILTKCTKILRGN